jgi:hypothetical protein
VGRGSGVGVHMHACVHSCVCVRVCVREREREREGKILIATLEVSYCGYYIHVCVCVWEREREREGQNTYRNSRRLLLWLLHLKSISYKAVILHLEWLHIFPSYSQNVIRTVQKWNMHLYSEQAKVGIFIICLSHLSSEHHQSIKKWPSNKKFDLCDKDILEHLKTS